MRAFLTLCVLSGGLLLACSDDGGTAEPSATTAPQALSTPTAFPGASDRVVLSGTLTLDGTPLEAQFLGARVVRDGLPAACQGSIPAVTEGEYEIEVLVDAEVRGCGAPGAEVVLWTFVGEAFLFSEQTLPWPGDGRSATFDATFSTTVPRGATTAVTEFKGELFDAIGLPLPAGTVVEAYVGDVLCGVTSLRYGDDNDRLYTLIVAGPESIVGCTEGATLTFLLDGEPAVETALNDLASGSNGHELNLTLR